MKPAKLPPEKIGYNAPSTEWGVIKSYLESNGFLIVESFAPRCPNCKDNPLMIFVPQREPYTENHWQCPYCDSTVIGTETTNNMTEVKKGGWIYWNYKNISTPSFSYSYVDDVIETKKDGKMLHLTDGHYTNYPLRVLARDINIVEKQNHN